MTTYMPRALAGRVRREWLKRANGAGCKRAARRLMTDGQPDAADCWLHEFVRPLFAWRICWILSRLRWFASFCMTRPSESIGRNGRRMRRQAGRMGFAAVFIDLGF